MQIKHPEILYALLLLLIPIIVHLFQLRRFQKVPFTNVDFLKKITLQTRKSSIIKKWLTLITRLLLLSAIILAFSQPYTSNTNSFNTKSETVIYLDNSYSMQAKGEKGPLLQRALQDILEHYNNENKLSIVTNNALFKNVSLSSIKNDLIQLGYSPINIDYQSAILKAEKLFSTDVTSIKNLICISDFQLNQQPSINVEKSNINLNFVQLKPVNTKNISVDSLYISTKTPLNIELTVILKNQGENIEDLSISIYNGEQIIAKTSTNIEDKAKIIFKVPNNVILDGKVVITDANLQFDNVLFFNISKPQQINVLTINGSDDTYLKKIYSKSEFNYKSSSIQNLNFSDIPSQNLVILNEIKSIPNSLNSALKSFLERDGYVLIIPSDDINLTSYNQLFIKINSIKYDALENTEKKVIKINFSHPLYSNVFNNKVSNFQYPKVKSFYPVVTNNTPLLSYEDSTPFLVGSNNLYVFSAAINNMNSNFQNSPLIVPTLYNMGKQSLKIPKPYFTIGTENKIDIQTVLSQDQVLVIENEGSKIIPQQQSFSNKVSLNTYETPNIAENYLVLNNTEVVGNLSYNYNRSESVLNYMDLNTDRYKVSNSLVDVLTEIKSNAKVNELWKWFIIFALIMLIIEMLILKFYK